MPAWGIPEPRRRSALYTAAGLLGAIALAPAGLAQNRPDLVSRDRLRICGDPANMPFSNKAREGFENKIADLVADELKVPVHYYWMPQGPGFVRNTLGTDFCDVIMGYASGADIVDHTNPYYVSGYVLITRKGGPLDGVNRLEDDRLKDSRLGVVAATPPADHLLRLGLTDHARTYALLVDRRFSSPAEDALADLAKGEIDAAILWGPVGGFFARRAAIPLSVAPLTETVRPSLAYRITFGIRPNEIEWKHRLNQVIRKRQKDIDAILTSFGVPILSNDAIPSEPLSRAGGSSGELQ